VVQSLRLADDFDDMITSSRFAVVADGDGDSAVNFMAASVHDPSLTTMQTLRYLADADSGQVEDQSYFHVPPQYQSDTSPPHQHDDTEPELPNGIIGLPASPSFSGDATPSRHDESIKASF
jgi:hypothetical protein